MFTKIKAFFTAKIFLTRWQIITQGMLYQLEKENADLRASLGGYKSGNTRLQNTNADLAGQLRASVRSCASLREELEAITRTVDVSLKRDPNGNEIDSDNL